MIPLVFSLGRSTPFPGARVEWSDKWCEAFGPKFHAAHVRPASPNPPLTAAHTDRRDGDRTRYGVVQAITYVAHAVNTDPEVRFTVERLAGAYLAATLV